MSKSLLIQQEDKVFGALPYGIEISNIPFDRLNNTVGGNVRTTEVKFTSIAENPVKLEYLSLESTFAGISGKMVNKQVRPLRRPVANVTTGPIVGSQ